ncbi:MAG: GNAT family N-acetyltransferase [Deltaproteobacteria bacterium]|nr:MAG: GNAT family N-acetyltransferase [Deltaproteobacteria bacterium]
MEVVRLDSSWEAATEELLRHDPVINLFLLGFLDVHPLQRALWLGATDGDTLHGVTLLVPGRLAVPYAPRVDAAGLIGAHLRRRRHFPVMTVGPRAATDALWGEWAPGIKTRCFFDQRLYMCDTPPAGERLPGFRRALEHEWRQIAHYAGLMEEEDLGRNPALEEGPTHEAVVVDRIRSGRTWVLERNGEILFQINVGTTTEVGCQVGGTYVPLHHRGKGYATAAMRELCRRLLVQHACVTLHVNEANTPAVALYERSGFTRAHPMRLITLEAG